MVHYRCDNCFRLFDRKSTYTDHLNRKNKCKPPVLDDSENENENSQNLHTKPHKNDNFEKIPQKIPQNDTCGENKNAVFAENLKNKINLTHNPTQEKNLDETKTINLIDDINKDNIISQNISCVKKISNDLIQEKLKNLTCAYCEKKFTRKDAVMRHMDNYCTEIKNIQNEKDKYMQKILEQLELLQKKSETLEKKSETLEKQNESLKKEVEEMKSKNNTSINNIANTNNSHNNINNGNINNGFVDNSQNIILVGYKKEDLSKIDVKKFIKILKRGFQAPIELTQAIHFDPHLPEYHNIYIPKWNEKIALCYDGTIWKAVDKNELAVDIYENKRAYIIEKWEDFADQLTDTQKNALKRWLNSKDNKDVEVLKEDIKRVLYNGRHLVKSTNEKIKTQIKNKKSKISKLK
jgi:chaperonin cofactor prefoldin